MLWWLFNAVVPLFATNHNFNQPGPDEESVQISILFLRGTIVLRSVVPRWKGAVLKFSKTSDVDEDAPSGLPEDSPCIAIDDDDDNLLGHCTRGQSCLRSSFSGPLTCIVRCWWTSVCRRLGSCSRADRGSEYRNTSWLNDGWVTSTSTLLNAREFLILLRLNRFHVSQMPKTYIYAMKVVLVVKVKWRKSRLTNDKGEVGLRWSPNLIYRVWFYRTTRELEYV